MICSQPSCTTKSSMDIGDYISELLVWVEQNIGIPIPDWIEQGLREIDFDLIYWLIRLFAPIIVTFLLPFILLIFIYGSILFLHIYKVRHKLVDAYSKGLWDGARTTIGTFWDGHGKIWHGFEIVGLDKVPRQGAALLVYYHGALPVDFYYIIAKSILQTGRRMHLVGDRFLFKVPGFKLLLQVFKVTPGSVEEISQLLRAGKLVAVAPGGVREALFSNSNYELLWGQRCGFAKSAIAAQVPIIPLFTQNLREAFRTVEYGQSYLRDLYERTRLPLVPIYGGFPVKLRTWIGDPIPYDPNITPEDLAKKTQHAIEDLIKKHQPIPGNIFWALLDRFSPKVS